MRRTDAWGGVRGRAIDVVIGDVLNAWPLATHARDGHLRALINPANVALCGTSLPYFPRGGPVPRPPPKALRASSSGWGGLDAGSGMLYPAQCVDGQVHAQGGSALRKALDAAAGPSTMLTDAAGQPVRCNEGNAVVTATGHGRLPFDLIAHAVPPFWPTPTSTDGVADDGEWARLLGSCYASSLRALRFAAEGRGATAAPGAAPSSLLIATPLLGAGARGAPVRAAARVAARALTACLLDGEDEVDEVGEVGERTAETHSETHSEIHSEMHADHSIGFGMRLRVETHSEIHSEMHSEMHADHSIGFGMRSKFGMRIRVVAHDKRAFEEVCEALISAFDAAAASTSSPTMVHGSDLFISSPGL